MTDAEKAIQHEIRELLSRGVTAVEFTERVFGPQGVLQGLAPTTELRSSLTQTELYRWLQGELAELRRREITEFEAETTTLSGRVTISIPKSLHAALKQEARLEGISLSELMRMKLAIKLHQGLRPLGEPRAGTGDHPGLRVGGPL